MTVLRCWRLLLRLPRRPATQRAANSVTSARDAQGGVCRARPAARSVSWVRQCWRGPGRGRWALSVGRLTMGGLRRRRSGRSAGRQRWDSGRRGRRPGDERGPGPRVGERAGSSGGGQQPKRAVRILLWPRSKRFQMRCKVRSLRWQSAARLAARMPSATASWRKRHRRPVVRLRRRILSATQTLKVRPQPGRAWRLLQKMRRARRVLRWGLLSSKPYRKPWRIKRADSLAVRTGGQLEPFGNGVAIPRRCGKTSVARPTCRASAKIVIVPATGRSGVAGYDKDP